MTYEMADVYGKLSKGDFVTAYFDDMWSSGKCRTLLVTSGPRKVKCKWTADGSGFISRIILEHPDDLGGVRYTLRNNCGNVSLSIGDMATDLSRLEYGKGNN